jgi:cellulose synthase/poly-beta-1,6-N-acetylglucosamine synthase-like glycosyltransferase
VTDVTQNNKPIRGKDQTAEVFLSRGQMVFYSVLALAAVVYGFVMPVTLLRVVVAAIIVFYLAFTGFKLLVTFAGAGYKFPHLNLRPADDPDLPFYTILVPMRDETARGFDLLLESLNRLVYPKDHLQVLFIVDEDDVSTLDMVRRRNLTGYMELIEVPDVGPRTKPKACNWAMQFVTGDRLVILDFEDRPEPRMLLKAVAALDYHRALDPTVACVQGMLQFWNPRRGTVNVFYWAEYVVNFRWMMTGLARLGLILPLGGTSNHFLVSALNEVGRQYGDVVLENNGRRYHLANVWDAFNVTEDAALAAQLRRCGFTIAMVDAVTFEEAPTTLSKAKGQRSRWLKGFMQTFLVQSRRPLRSMREMGVLRYLMFNLYIGGTPLSFLINPIMWATTVLYIVSRFAGWESITLFIESLFPPAIYYPAMFVAIVGNFVLWYQMLLTTLDQQERESFTHLPVRAQQEQFGLSLKLFFGVFPWWMFTTVPAYKGMSELVRKKTRTFWNLTDHGASMHLEDEILGGGGDPDATAALSGRPGQPALTSGRHRPGRVGDTAEQKKVY